MRQSRDYRASIILAATLASGALGAACVARVGYCDTVHRDDPLWDDRDDRVYRHFLSERHEKHRDWESLSAVDQNEYWRWRHDHPDDR